MRVLLFSRAWRSDTHVRLLAFTGAGLVERGAEVGYITRAIPEIQLQFQNIGEVSWSYTFENNSPVREIAATKRALQSFRPEVVITDGEKDSLLVSILGRRRIGVVRRWRTGSNDGAKWGWRSRIASRLSTTSVLLPFGTDTLELPSRVRVARVPVSLPLAPGESDDTSESQLAIACLPDGGSVATALCLRSVARLRQRRPDFSLVLLGEPSELQAARVHAAALGLVTNVRMMPTSALFERDPFPCVALWIARDGDEGALAAAAAMTRGIPVVVDRNSDVSSFVAHRITGIHADAMELAPTISGIAQWIADPVSLRSAREASLARAQRVHSWQNFLDKVLEAVEAVRRGRIAQERSLQPGASV